MSSALMANYNLAEFIRDRLVPRAVLFFTGEAVEEDSDVEECSVSMKAGLTTLSKIMVMLVISVFITDDDAKRPAILHNTFCCSLVSLRRTMMRRLRTVRITTLRKM